MAFKFNCCLTCRMCFYNIEESCTICKICEAGSMYEAVSDEEIETLDLAMKTEDSKMRYYMDLNSTLKNSIDNCELTIDN